MHTYAGSMDVTYQVVIPNNIAPRTLSLASGDVKLRPGTTHHLRLGERDIARLVELVPGVRLKAAPVVEPPKVVEVNVGMVDVKVEAGDDGVLGTDDDEVTLSKAKRRKGKEG